MLKRLRWVSHVLAHAHEGSAAVHTQSGDWSKYSPAAMRLASPLLTEFDAVCDADALAVLDIVRVGLLLLVADREGVLVTDELVVFVRVREGVFVGDADALVVFVRVRVGDTDALVLFVGVRDGVLVEDAVALAVRVRERVGLRLGVRVADGVALRDDPRLGVRDGLGASMRGVRSSRLSSSLFASPLATLRSQSAVGAGSVSRGFTMQYWQCRLRQS
jgi:hypothetical protein